MPIGVNQYPILTPEQANPIGTGIEQAIRMRLQSQQARHQAAQAQEKENTNPYAARGSYAKSQSELAYSRLVGPQFMAKLLEHDPAFASLKKADKDAVLNSISTAAQGINSQSYEPAPPIGNWQDLQGQQQGQDQSPLENMIGGIKNLLMGGQQQQQTMQQGQIPANASMNQGAQQQETNEPQDIKARRKAYIDDLEKSKAKAAAEGKTEGEIFGNTLTDVANSSKEALKLGNELDRFHEVYNNSLLVGPLLGKLSKYGPEAAQLPSLSASMQTAVAAQLFGSKTSNYKELLAKDIKLNSELPRAAEAKNYRAMKAETDRLEGMSEFFSAARKLGINDDNDIKNLWHNYNKDVPFFDFKKNQPIEQNLSNNPEEFYEYIQNKLEGGSSSVSKANKDPLGWR